MPITQATHAAAASLPMIKKGAKMPAMLLAVIWLFFV